MKQKRKNIMKFFGKWPGDKNDLDKIKKRINEDRKNFKLKEAKF